MEQKKPLTIEISAKTIIFTIITLLLLGLIWLMQELIFSFVIAFIVSSALNPVVVRLQLLRIPRSLAAILVFVALLFGMGYLFSWILPPVISETTILFKNLPDYLQSVHVDPAINRDVVSKYIPDITGNAFTFVRTTLSNVLFVISTLFFSFYFLMDEQVVKNLIIRFFDKKQAQIIASVFDRTQQRLRNWMWAELLLMLSIGIATYIGLLLLGIKYALPLAILAGLLEAVPIIGPIISAVPAFLITLPSNLFLALTVCALYFIIQQVENQIFVPIIMRRTVGLNPIVTLAALIIGGKLGGITGLLLAIPFTLCIETVLVEAIKYRNLASESA